MTSPALQEILALFGCPAAGNPSQYLFERAIAAAGLDWRFLTCDVSPDRIADALAGAAAMGFRGCLLSGALREAALPLVSVASPAAGFSGAVSLVERRDGAMAGHMTDGRGVVEALRGHCDPAGMGVLVVGAGPAARAAALELSLAGAGTIWVGDPDAERTAALVAGLTGLAAAPALALPWEPILTLPGDARIVVLAGPAATMLSGLRGDLIVADVLLAPQPSAAAAAAAAQGACLVDGLEIHAAQTAIDFHALTGIEPDTEMLRDALDEFLS